jgi:two-component system LytT family sensor kinase
MFVSSSKLPNKARLYFLCQFFGWGGYGLAMSVFYRYSTGHDLTINEFASIFSLCLLAFGLTHLFRIIFKRNQWIEFPLPKLVILVLFSNLIMATMYASTNLVIDRGLDLVSAELNWKEWLVSMSILVVNSMTLFLLWSVIYFAIAFFSRYRREEIERLKWENALKEFELNKLKSQLNPHFVFNALNGIRGLVGEDPNKAKAAITMLSNILRNSLLSDRARTIPLSEELKTVNDYLNLEKIRFEERLRFSTDLEPLTLSVHVPPMMIQTLVENAVKHGLSKRVDGGQISITSKIDKNFAEIRIDNTGKLNGTDSGGFGIVNTLHRLELIFNKPDLFSIVQTNLDTVSAIIKIPLTK